MWSPSRTTWRVACGGRATSPEGRTIPPLADVRTALEQLTALASGELVELGRGADSAAYLLDGEWVVRVPVTANAQRTLRCELALLDDLAAWLPLPVPAIAHVARSDDRLLLAAYERVHQPQTARCAVLHGDLKPAHVLHDAAGGQITGVLDWGDVSLGDPDFDLAVIGIFFGREFLARLPEHLPDRDPAVVREKARFFTTLRRLQDLRYDLDHGDAATMRPAVDRLREHLHDH